MRLALVHKRLDLKGGTETDLYRTAEGLRDAGHEVHLFCGEFGIAAPVGTVAHCISVSGLGRTLKLWNFAHQVPRAVRPQRCDLTIGFGRLIDQDVLRCGGGTHAGFLEKLAQEGGWRRKLWQDVSLYHRSLVRFEKRQFSSPLLRAVIAVSDEVASDIARHYPAAAEKVRVLYNGVDTERFQSGRRSSAGVRIRSRWNIPPAAPLLLFVGSGFRRKGLDRLLSAWRCPALDRVYLLVVGEDARRAKYEATAREIASQRIVFTGRQERVEDYYAAADAVALPSIQEAFGNVALEALACGLPVVLSGNAGAAPLLQGALSRGLVDRADDPQALAATIVEILGVASQDRIVTAARKIAESYSWQSHFQRLNRLLLDVANIDTGAAA